MKQINDIVANQKLQKILPVGNIAAVLTAQLFQGQAAVQAGLTGGKSVTAA